jgi:hypothetical protein
LNNSSAAGRVRRTTWNRVDDRDNETTLALSKLDPGRLADQLLATAKDKQLDSYVREGALITLCTVSATKRVRELIPLLDDVAPIN